MKVSEHFLVARMIRALKEEREIEREHRAIHESEYQGSCVACTQREVIRNMAAEHTGLFRDPAPWARDSGGI